MRGKLEIVVLFGLGLFFFYAGAVKLVDVATFMQSVEQYRLIDGFLAWGVALWVPWVECLAALGLWIKSLRRGSLWILTGLLVVFEIILLSALVRGLDISCGCLGSGSESSVLFAFGRNIVLLIIVIGLLALTPRTK
jgi:putative oxidoreductase